MTEPLLERDRKLRDLVDRLIEAYRPERIYLFGSMARQEAGPDSDYDLMVVVPDDAARMDRFLHGHGRFLLSDNQSTQRQERCRLQT